MGGQPISTVNHVFNTGTTELRIGVELDDAPNVNMDVAEILVYDRVLTEQERQQVESYLEQEYFNIAPSTGPTVNITSPAAGTTIIGDSVTVSWEVGGDLVNGDHVHLTLDDAPDHVTVMELNGSYTFTGLAAGAHTIKAQVASIGHVVYSNAEATDLVSFNTLADSNNALPVTDGLVLHLESDLNITTATGNTVGGWLDQSGNGNDLYSAGDPQVGTVTTPSGQPAISFDGTGDKLERVTPDTLTGFPTGAADRTVFFVAQYNSNGYGGLAYGNAGQCNQVFGLVTKSDGDLTVQGWCNDFDSNVDGTGAGWLVQSVTVDADNWIHYKDGVQIAAGTHTFNTGANMLVIGAEIDSNPYINVDVAAALIYDRALTEQERQQVEAYLQDKYFSTTTTTSLDGVVELQAWQGSDVELAVELYQAGVMVDSYTPIANANTGAFSISGLTPGTYEIAVRHSKSLQVVETVTLSEGANSVNFGLLLGGDANGDNVVSALDFSVLSGTFNLSAGDVDYDARADFNGSDSISAQDFSILASNFNISGAEIGN